MFTTPCIIGNNTPELRERLENLGYKYSGADGKTLDYIITFPHKALYSIFDKWHIIKQPKVFSEWIPCRADNEELFLALAALRDDSDYMQWFISPKTHMHKLSGCFGQIVGMDGYYKEIIGYEWYRHENKDNALTERLNTMIQMEVEDMEFLPHKATVKEIIEHFNDK